MNEQYDITLSKFTNVISEALINDIEIVTTSQFRQEYAHGDCARLADVIGHALTEAGIEHQMVEILNQC